MWHLRATKLAWVSDAESSIEIPLPPLRISTPKIFIAVAAPSSVVPARVMSKGRIWSLNQGCARSLKPETSLTCVQIEGVLGSVYSCARIPIYRRYIDQTQMRRGPAAG
jgi:hypothetical protein